MRMTHLLAFAAPLALLLPLSAQAAWPKDLKAQYMAQCVPCRPRWPWPSPRQLKQRPRPQRLDDRMNVDCRREE